MKAWLLKALYFGLPALLLAATVLVLNTGTIMKRPMSQDDNVPDNLQALLSLAVNQEWDEARSTVEHIHRAWNKVRGRVHITSTTDEIELFDLELAGLQGAVEGSDATQVRMAVRRLTALWDDLGS
jgi:hypothetical protein